MSATPILKPLRTSRLPKLERDRAVAAAELARQERDAERAERNSRGEELAVANLEGDGAVIAAELARQERDAEYAERISAKKALDEAGLYARHVEREYTKALAEIEKTRSPYPNVRAPNCWVINI